MENTTKGSNTRTIRIYAKEYSKDGQHWWSYTYKNSKGEFLNIKFNLSCGTDVAPKTKGYWSVTFEPNQIYPDRRAKTPTYRLKQVLNVERYFFPMDDLDEVFDVVDDDLPF